MGFPMALVVMNPPANAGGHRFHLWVGKIPCRSKWLPTPGESQGQRSLVGYSPWGCKESDMTEQLRKAQHSSQCAASLNKAEPGTLGGPRRETDMTENEDLYRVNWVALMYFLLTTVK